jgi:hypothetical protein
MDRASALRTATSATTLEFVGLNSAMNFTW